MKTIPVESVQPELLRRIRADAGKFFGLASEPEVTAVWLIRNPYSKVLCIRLSRGGWARRVFAKVPARPATKASTVTAQMRNEFEILLTLANGGPLNDRASTVLPLSYYPDLPSLVTIEAPGPTLRRAYSASARRFAARRGRAELAERVMLCGEWLNDFHERTSRGVEAFDVNGLLAYCATRLDTIRKFHPAIFSVRESDALIAGASKICESISASGLRVSGRHNDFASHNIIASFDGGVRVLDFTMYDYGSNSFDVCSFWFELEMLKCDPSYSPRFLADLQRSFLKSYGDVSIESPEFRLARLRYSLNRLLTALARPDKAKWISPQWHMSIYSLMEWLRNISKA